jgi:DNA polymerase III delta prime subunit
MFGSGWKVIVANEADRMTAQAETVWLDRLESLPPRTVIVFTTNYPEKLSQRLRDRCTRLVFEAQATAEVILRDRSGR